MTQHEFDLLAEKYVTGQCSSEEIALLEKWAAHHYDEKYTSPNEVEAKILEKQLWQRIESETDLRPIKNIKIPQWIWIGVAACLTVVIGYFVVNKPKSAEIAFVPKEGIETKNRANSRQKVVLPDGSIVMLEKNASIVTDENYGRHSRSVYLTGEAFFEVKRNEKVPFLVHAGDLITEVLGTSFRIKPQQNTKTIEVSVKTGRVSVYSTEPQKKNKRNGVILTPNQKILFNTELKTMEQGIVDLPQLVNQNMKVSDFQFEEATIVSVLKLLQGVYGVEIEVANPVLNQCAFTGDLNGLDMYKQLDLICESISAQYEIRGTTIFVLGNGCK
ncbi:MAG: FecR family protein [Spirosomataceae bacterium]